MRSYLYIIFQIYSKNIIQYKKNYYKTLINGQEKWKNQQ